MKRLIIFLLAIPLLVFAQDTNENYRNTSVIRDIPEKPKEVVKQVTKINPIYCSCVKTARAEGLVLPPIYTPWDLVPNTGPSIGAGVLMSYSGIGHVAVIIGMTNEGIIITEGNFKACQKQTRMVSYNDPHIRGYWKPL